MLSVGVYGKDESAAVGAITPKSFVGDEAEAEDIMQRAYVNAYAHLRQFDGRVPFATWLSRASTSASAAARAGLPGLV